MMSPGARAETPLAPTTGNQYSRRATQSNVCAAPS
jgi:hypothetical protein